MKAVQIDDYGGPEVLTLREVPVPAPGAGQVLVRVRVSGVNPADWKYRAGFMKQFMPLQMPWIPGLEGAGQVEAVGPDVQRFQVGQAVFGRFSGSYAEYALAAEGDLQLKPEKLSFEEAAAIPVGALTAWSAVIETAQVQAGQRVLIHGAAGGVGAYAVQLAHWKGAWVIGSTSKANIEFVRSLGADEVVDYTAGPFEKAVQPVDVVIDTVGGDLPERSLQILRRGGKLVTVAARLDSDFGKEQGVTGLSGGRTGGGKLAEIVKLVEEGKIRSAVGMVFPLSEARAAQEMSQNGHGRGRMLLKVV